MSTATITSKQVVEDYFKALSGKPKTEEVIDQWVDDPHLKQHILQFESSFPDYQLTIEQIVGEDDLVAVSTTVNAIHKGAFAGIEPTGKPITTSAMMFYKVSEGRIAQFWMQADIMTILTQLKG